MLAAFHIKQNIKQLFIKLRTCKNYLHARCTTHTDHQIYQLSTSSSSMDQKMCSDKEYIEEGSTEILSNGNVFYNPVQEFNRDLSILVLNTYSKQMQNKSTEEKGNGAFTEKTTDDDDPMKSLNNNQGLRILEALSATGLRSIRYAKEVHGIKEIVANDISKKAVESIKSNIEHNNVSHLITANNSDAMTLMYLSTAPNKRFHAIDLDPYGCPNRFLDGAVQSLCDGGLLLVTATDMAVLAGNTPEACFVKYGTVPLRTKCCHEMAIRILLRCIEGHANRYGRYIEPLLCISADFYIRVFVKIYTSQFKCKYTLSKQSMVYQCTGCEMLTLQPLGIIKPNNKNNTKSVKFSLSTGPAVEAHCEHCQRKHHLGGPIWSAPIHSQEFVEELLKEIQQEDAIKLGTKRRIIGILSVIQEELKDIPFYYSIEKLCSILKLEVIPVLKFRSALLHAGYTVSYSHACKNSIKTNASSSVLWDILRCWEKKHPVNKKHLIDGSVIKNILDKKPENEYNLDSIHPNANPDSRKNALARFPENPAPHWGPGTRATLMIGDKITKSLRNQNKKSKHKNSDEDGIKSDKILKLDENND